MPALKQQLCDGERVNVFALSRLSQPNMIEMYAIHGGFEGFWIDYEHAGFSVQELETATAFGRAANLDCFVRIPPTDYALVTRCLESGASGVMAAQIETAEQAEEFVQWAKFAPRGKRGMNGGGYDGHFGNLSAQEFCRSANERSFVAIQIETMSALEECEKIAAIDGVDLLFIGPSDLSQALGVTGQFMHEKCVEAIERVALACRQTGKSWGAVTTTPEHASLLIENGCQLLSPTNDVRTFNMGIKATQAMYPELFPITPDAD